MYWLYGTKKTLAPILPFYTLGEELELTFTLVVEIGETLDKTSLCCIQKEHAGWFQAKRSTETRYQDIGIVFDPTCYLGYFGEGSYDIDFKILIPEDADAKLHTIPIMILHDDGAVWPDSTFCGSLDVDIVWADEFEHMPLWNGALGGCPNFETGSICVRQQVETVTFDASVMDYDVCWAYIDDNGDKVYWWARNGYSPYEMVVVGIATDVANSELTTQGFVTNDSWNWTPGKQLLLSDVPGQMTQTRPSDSGGDDVICGMAVTSKKICFYSQPLDRRYTFVDLLREGSADATDGIGTVWFFGGQYSGGAFSNEVDIYDVLTGETTSGTPGGPSVRDHMAVYDEDTGLVYVWGGIDSGGNYNDEMWAYDPTGDSWTQLTSGGTARTGAVVSVEDGKIYYFIGENADGTVTDIDIYDITTDTWSVDDTAPGDITDIIDTGSSDIIGSQTTSGNTITITGITHLVPSDVRLAGGLYDNKLWYITSDCLDPAGGKTTFLYYDLVYQTWTRLDTSGGPGGAYFAAIIGTKFYAWRGFTYLEESGAEVSSELWVFDLLSSSWTQLASGGNPDRRDYSTIDALSHMPGSMCMYAYNGKLYVWGGWDCASGSVYGTEDYLDVYDPSTNTWSQILTDVTASRTKFGHFVDGGYLYACVGATSALEPDLIKINLSTGAVSSLSKPLWYFTSSGNRANLGTAYEGKHYLFDRSNYEIGYLNAVDLMKDDGHYGYKSLTRPAFAASTPINYSYLCYIPTYSVDGTSITFSPWAWDMRSQPAYYPVYGWNGTSFVLGTWDSATIYTWDSVSGWSPSSSSGAYWKTRGTYAPSGPAGMLMLSTSMAGRMTVLRATTSSGNSTVAYYYF